MQLQNLANDFTGKEAMYLIQLKYSYVYSRTAQPPKVLLVSRLLSNSFLPWPSIDTWLLSLPKKKKKKKKNSTCISLVKSLHRAFNPESVHPLELHSIVCCFFFLLQEWEKFCSACQWFGSFNFCFNRSRLPWVPSLYTIHIGKMKMKCRHLPFLFIRDF